MHVRQPHADGGILLIIETRRDFDRLRTPGFRDAFLDIGQHFRGKREILGAVALEGMTELTAALRAAVADQPAGRPAVAALARAYTDFATGNPALYDAMFSLDNGLPFGVEATPVPLREAFQALLDPLEAHAGPDEEPGIYVETFWAALHGLITLTRAGRLPADRIPSRLTLLVNRFVDTEEQPPAQ